MSQVCNHCYMVVQRACQTPTEATGCKNLQRSRDLGLPKVIQHEGPLTRLGRANTRSKK